jgi:hypothetical protein
MAGLGGIVSLLVKNAVKSAVKFELAIDPIIARFESQCPPKNELDKILQQKNQLSQAITQIETSLTSLSSTGSTIDSIVTGVKAGVTLIKALPVPSSVPPGVGIPLNVINGFSDTLDTLGILLKEFGGVTSQIAPSLQIITGTLSTVNVKLSTLDGLLAGCLQSETEGMTDLEKEEFFQSLGIDLSSPDNTGGSNNPNNGAEGENTDVNETLENRLSPNSNNPIVYKGFTITLDNDAGNQFSFPSRRAIGTNEEGVKIVTSFSFSSSTQVLVDAIKFQIDQTDSLELARLARESKIEQLNIQETRTKADIYYKSYITYIKNDINSIAFKFKNFTNLDALYNQAVEEYRALLALSPTDEYAKSQLAKLKKSQDNIKRESKSLNLDFLGGAPTGPLGVTPSPTTPSVGSVSGVAINQYNPIGRPGSVNGEVVVKGGQAWRFLGGTPDKWVKHTISYLPFTSGGTFNSEFRDKTSIKGIIIKKDTYRWNQSLQKWIFVSATTS